MVEHSESIDDPVAKKQRTKSPAGISDGSDEVQCLEDNRDGQTRDQLDSRKRQLLSDFMSISSADEDTALSLLQSSQWNVNRALDLFFGNEEEDDNEVAQPPETQSSCESAPVDLSGLEVSLVSWNIDGLDGNSLATRFKAVYKIVNKW
ncbi:hypothetical protein OSTOST_03938, partial [Ostertagia ostertagi]